MSNNIELKQLKKDENPSSGGGRKTTSLKPLEQSLKCPRCDSTNTKFCYFNNYNLTQPRHFCKTCRRYWTKGGALRNIPIGGGCRKNKKATKSCSSKFLIGDSSTDNGGLKLLDGVSTPVMDFQFGGLTYPPRVNQFSSSYGENVRNNSIHFMNIDPLGFNQNGGRGLVNFQEMGLTYTNSNYHHNTNLTSSIESLSSLNQDLHWKLQQQRVAMLFGGGGGGGSGSGSVGENNHEKYHQEETSLQPILFQNLEISKPTQSSMGSESRKDGSVGGLATEWFLDNNYAPLNVNPNSAGNAQNANINNWSGIQAWNHMNQYNALP